MSDITPEDVVADLFAAEDTRYDDSGNGWHHKVTGSGNVIEIAITPSDDDGFATHETRHFRAFVVEVPVFSVAAAPVTLPADLARELAYGYAGDDVEGWTVVANDYVSSLRWSTTHRLVIRNEAGEHFADTYRRGRSESQETRPYEDASTATFTPVEPTFQVVTEWTSAQSGGAA